MTVVLDKRWDVSLEAFYRVAWAKENVRISDAAMRCITAARTSFLNLIEDDPAVVIYGVTTSMGELANQRLSPEERDRHARIKPFPAATSFGDYLPERVVRGIVLARLTNFIEGHAATTPRIAEAVVQMLDGGPLPPIAAAGQGGAGEILALYPLFADLSRAFDLQVKERGSLINGSPCAAALVADAALSSRRRLQLVLQTFALSIEAFRAPLEHYDAALELLWGDPDETAVLQALRELLVGAGDGRRHYQAPVSYRIVPRVLGRGASRGGGRRTCGQRVAGLDLRQSRIRAARQPNIPMAAASAPAAITTPWPPRRWMTCRPSGPISACCASVTAPSCSTAASRSCPTCCWWAASPARAMAAATSATCPWRPRATSNSAKANAQRTFIHGSDAGQGQDDVASPVFHAWSKEERAGRLLDASMAMLAVVASQALHVTDRPIPPALRDFTAMVRSYVPPLIEDRILGPELGRLAEALTAEAFAVEEKKTEPVFA